MDRITRKELKTDHFTLEVEHGVEYVSTHRDQFVKYGGIGLAVAFLVLGILWWRNYQHAQREQALTAALEMQNATVGPSMNEYQVTYPNQAEKDKATNKAFSEIAAKYSGTDEGYIAEYYLGAAAADKGDMAQAAKRYQLVADSGPKAYASLAKLSLAQIDASQGKTAEAEKLVRSVIDNPTVLVSKDQATIALAHILAPTKPQEARKLLEPLRGSQRSAVSRAALSALSEIPQK